jgi:hypothetical protein
MRLLLSEEESPMRYLRFAALTVGLALLVGVTLTGCGGGGDNKPSTDGKTNTDGGTPGKTVAPGKGTLKGVALIKTDDVKKLIAEAQAKHDELTRSKANEIKHCIDDVPESDKQAKEQQKWRISDKGGVQDVLVWLKPVEAKDRFATAADDPNLKWAKGEGKEVVVNQPYCAFEPHVMVLFPIAYDKDGKPQHTGQKLRVKGSPHFAHNTQINGAGIKFNENATKEGEVFEPKAKAKAELVQINCAVHPQMKAFFLVMDNPYFAKTDKDGNYEIKDVPKGKVRLFAWKEGTGDDGYLFGKNGKEIEFKEGEEKTENLDIKPE